MYCSKTKGARMRITVLLLAFLVLSSLPAAAQSVQGDPTDLKFEIINATTGEPGEVERMTIEYVRSRRNGILDFEPSGSSFIAPAVPIKDVGQYIVGVWHDGVPYWWSLRGHQLIGQTTTLHVFDTTSDLKGASITGMNLVIRRQTSLLNLEYMITVDNAAKPQRTITDRVATFELDFPAQASRIEATYRRGPDPTSFAADTHGSQRLSLAVPLTPGSNQIRIEAVLPWQEGMELPVGSDLDIAAWSVLATPEWLEVRAIGLESSASADLPGINRLTGPPLAAGRHMPLQLFAGEHETAEATDLFTQTAPAADAGQDIAGEGEGDGGNFPLPFVFGGVLIIIVIAVAVRRRQ